MKKLVLVLALCLAVLFTLSACTFIPQNKTDRLVKKYGTPQVEITYTYNSDYTLADDDDMVVTIVYDLLLDKAPITVANFVDLVLKGTYENAIMDSYNTSELYTIMGRYRFEEDKYYEIDLEKTFVGEFESNGYKQPQGGYAEFSMFSLAMYHESTPESFDSANGTMIFANAKEDASTTLNGANYAVFARPSYIIVTENGGEPTQYPVGHIPSYLFEHFKRASVSSKQVYDATGDSKTVSIMKHPVLFTAKMVEKQGIDWEKFVNAVI